MSISEYNAGIPENIRRIINDKGMKQSAVAKRAGFTEQQLCDMLNSRRIIKVSDIKAISTALGVSILDIYGAGAQDRLET